MKKLCFEFLALWLLCSWPQLCAMEEGAQKPESEKGPVGGFVWDLKKLQDIVAEIRCLTEEIAKINRRTEETWRETAEIYAEIGQARAIKEDTQKKQ